jgi:hypothetical protein
VRSALDDLAKHLGRRYGCVEVCRSTIPVGGDHIGNDQAAGGDHEVEQVDQAANIRPA